MAIISVTALQNELAKDATNENGDITNAVSRASAAVNGWATHYDYFDDWDTTNDVARAPDDIVQKCLEVGKAFYAQAEGRRNRDGNEVAFWRDLVQGYKADVMAMTIEPTWETLTISLDSNNAQIIGDRNGGGTYPRVIPARANIVSAASNTWVQPDDFQITMGGRFDDEEPDAWYLYAESSSVEGTLRYMRTYRNDALDYGRYLPI